LLITWNGHRHAVDATFMLSSGALTLQDEFAVEVFEEIVRFHLLSEHDLCEEEASSEFFESHVLPCMCL
jgi:hypothetical protein